MVANPIAIPRQVRNIYMVRTVSFVWCLLVVGLATMANSAYRKPSVRRRE